MLGEIIERKRKKEIYNAKWRAKNREHMRDYAQRYRDERKSSNVEVRGG